MSRKAVLFLFMLVLCTGGIALGATPMKLYLPLVPGPAAGPQLGGCPVFPSNNAWNQDISSLPIDPRSDAYVAAITGQSRGRIHPDFGSNPEYGIPFVVVPASQPMVPVDFVLYPEESDPGPYPLPDNAPIEGGSDHHVLVLQQEKCKLYELYRAVNTGEGWEADSGAVWDLRSNALRPLNWTSADAAGLPILPGLVRYDEVASGKINHALRFTVSRSQHAYILPATHAAGSTDDPNYPPMGLRLRLKATYDISGFTGHSRVILEALKRYGMIVADNGSSWYISGATDARWDDDDLNQLKGVPGSAFEVVQTGEIVRP